MREPDLPRADASCGSYRPDVDADLGGAEGGHRAEAGAAERLLLLGSATTRGCQMGTCKKRPQRDRGPRRAQGQAPCRILFCRHTASAPEPCRRPCLLDECALRGCRLLPETGPRIGNRFGNLQGYRQRDRPNNGDSACFRRPDPSGAFADPSRPPHPALSDAPACRTSIGPASARTASMVRYRPGRMQITLRVWRPTTDLDSARVRSPACNPCSAPRNP